MMAHIRLYRLPLCAGQSGIEPTETVFAFFYFLAAVLHPLRRFYLVACYSLSMELRDIELKEILL